MMFARPAPESRIDQGDILDGCPLLGVLEYDPDNEATVKIKHVFHRVVVLTQTCDLENQKVSRILVAVLLPAQTLVEQRLIKPADVKGVIRQGRVFGWYFLPRNAEGGLPESIVDFRQLHTVRLDLLQQLCQRGKRLTRLQPLYREHLAKHFADTYSRIGLPEPYPSD